MAKNKKRLGKGLDFLVSDLRNIDNPENEKQEQSSQKGSAGNSSMDSSTDTFTSDTIIDSSKPGSEQQTASKLHMIPEEKEAISDIPLCLEISNLTPNPFQPRKDPSEASIAKLAESIKNNGIMQPILVRKSDSGYQIIAGERRFLAAQYAGLVEVPVVIKELNDKEMLEWALVENIQREDLNAIDRAEGYQRYCDTFNLTVEEVAGRMGEDRSTVTNYIRLLRLPDSVKGMLVNNEISMGHARALLSIQAETDIEALASKIINDGLSVRATEAEAKVVKMGRGGIVNLGGSSAVGPNAKLKSAHLVDVQNQIEKQLGTKVVIKESSKKGKGKIVLDYYNLDDFDRILEKLGVLLD